MAIGDAMGARVEFLPLDYNYNGIKDMGKDIKNNFKLKPGQWTDDTSMGLCISDSLIEKKGEFDPRDIMMRFILWWRFGYNNSFRFDTKRKNRHSVGLGGNISESIKKYIKDSGKNEYTKSGDKNTSGNGSIMRNAAIPLCYFRDEEKALEFAKKQSLITHQGEEAAGCCQLMTFIILKILKTKKILDENNKDDKQTKNKDTKDLDNSNVFIVKNNEKIIKYENKKNIKLKDILEDLKDFNCEYKSVICLANSKIENKDKNRNWNWKDKDFKYSEERAKEKPGYIGSYCMDGLAMALHVLYHTDTFEKAILKAVNLRGDADSVGSIVGQIAGAFYEFDSIPEDWIKEVNRWDKDEIALRGFLLCHLNGKEEKNKEKIGQEEITNVDINNINNINNKIDEEKIKYEKVLNNEGTNILEEVESKEQNEIKNNEDSICCYCCFYCTCCKCCKCCKYCNICKCFNSSCICF